MHHLLGSSSSSELLRISLQAFKAESASPRVSIIASSPPPPCLHVCGILHRQFATKQRLSYVQPEFLAWEHRLPLILRELEDIQADLVCLQEVDTHRSGGGYHTSVKERLMGVGGVRASGLPAGGAHARVSGGPVTQVWRKKGGGRV